MGLFGPPDIDKLKTKGDVHGLVKALGYQKDGAVRAAAAHALGEIGASAVEPLIAALGDQNADVRWGAAGALGDIGDARAVEPLIAALGDQNTDVRQRAAGALGDIGDARAVEPLVAALKDTERYVRWDAVEALGRIGDARAVEPLVAALADEEGSVCKAAAKALDQLAWRPDGGAAGVAYYWALQGQWGKCVEIGAPAVEPLLGLLSGEYDVRKAAAHALGEIGAPAVEPLIAALAHGTDDARGLPAEVLGQIGDARAVEPLIAALTDPKDYVRAPVARALGKIGDPRAVKPLIGLLTDNHDYVREAADGALGKIGALEHIEPLIAGLRAQAGTLPADQLLCVTCSKMLQDWHYGFESIILSRGLGWQCSSCGQVFCVEHAPSTFRNQGDKCSCGGWVTTLDEGPALSSMVEAAARDGKYDPHFRSPGSKRNVRQE